MAQTVLPYDDPFADVRQQVEDANRGNPPEAHIDAQELQEREEAAKAYFGEEEIHFVRFLDDCVQQSVDSMVDIRRNQKECWEVFNEEEPANYALKESWQSKVVVPKPYSSVQFFLAIVRKAFHPDFLSIENEADKEAAEFWTKLMALMLSRTYANFPIRFTDATGMGGAIGQSMEMIPQWIPGRGLQYVLVEPSKIHRDPQALSREPQSGMYWAHQEWLDYYVLKDGLDHGQYQNISDCGPGGTWGSPKDTSLTPEELARRKGMLWQASTYRTFVLTTEYWGTILDKRGEILLPSGTFQVAADRVIRLPKASPYPTLRWPGTGFSPLPHLLRFDGRALIQGIKSLWYFMNNLMALHADNLNWDVNPPKEVDISSLCDQDDVDDYPGKMWQTRGTVSGNQAVRTIERKSKTGDILANLNFADQRFQEGVMINKETLGLPGSRAQVTARESSQNLEQSQHIVGYMGENIEDGALYAIIAGAETVAINITQKELAALGEWGQKAAQKYYDPKSPTMLTLPRLSTGSFRVSGVATLMKNQEVISAITNVVLPMYDPAKLGQVFLPYLEPYKLCRAVERRLNLKDEGLFVTEDKAIEIAKAQQLQQDARIEAQKQREAADAALAAEKAATEAKKGTMHEARAEEHIGKATLSHAQAGVTGTEAPEASPATPPPSFRDTPLAILLTKFDLLTKYQQNQVLKMAGIDPGPDVPALPLQPEGAGIGNPEGTPLPAPPAETEGGE